MIKRKGQADLSLTDGGVARLTLLGAEKRK